MNSIKAHNTREEYRNRYPEPIQSARQVITITNKLQIKSKALPTGQVYYKPNEPFTHIAIQPENSSNQKQIPKGDIF